MVIILIAVSNHSHSCTVYTRAEAVAQRCSVKKDVLRNFAKFTGKHLKHLCHSLLFTKVKGLGLNKERYGV